MTFEQVIQQEMKLFKDQFLEDFKALLGATDNAAMNKQWVRSKEMQKILSISSSTLQNMRNSGSLPYKKIDGVILYPLHEILDKLKS